MNTTMSVGMFSVGGLFRRRTDRFAHHRTVSRVSPETVWSDHPRLVRLSGQDALTVVHFLIGYGFLFLRPWACLAGLWGFGLVSEAMNQLTFGFHHLRTGFMLATIFFLGYLLWRRQVFTEATCQNPSIGRASEETR